MQWPVVDEGEEPALYATDEFRIRVMKITRCSKKYCHDWTRCPFAHPGEKATRRDPAHGTYAGIACPDMRREQRCPRGGYCPYAHNVFEYWLHPSRYRTAICRDGDRCSRKVCFFAHNTHELRTNVERPYVAPEQLLAASQAAANDSEVLEAYHAADPLRVGARSVGPRNIFAGVSDADTGQTLEEMRQSGGLPSIAAPAATAQQRGEDGSDPADRARTFQNLTELLRGGPEASTPTDRQRESDSGLLPSASSRDPMTLSDTSPMYRMHDIGEASSSLETAESPHALSEKASQSQPRALHIAGPAKSWGSQQNLINASLVLSRDPSLSRQSAVGAPQTPSIVDHNTLYSTQSTISDRHHSLGSSNFSNRNIQRTRRQNRPMRRQSNSSIGQSSLNSQLASTYTGGSYAGASSHPASITFTGGSQHSHPLYTSSSTATMSTNPLASRSQDLQSREYAMSQQLEYALSQQQQNLQNTLLLQQLRQQAEYDRQLNAHIQQSLAGRSLSIPQTPLDRRDLAPPAQMPETGFDLRFGGLGENQGLLTQQPQDPTPMYYQLNSLLSAPQAEFKSALHSTSSLAPQTLPHSTPASLEASFLQGLQSRNLRDVAEEAATMPLRRGSVDGRRSGLPVELDLQGLRFSDARPGGGAVGPT